VGNRALRRARAAAPGPRPRLRQEASGDVVGSFGKPEIAFGPADLNLARFDLHLGDCPASSRFRATSAMERTSSTLARSIPRSSRTRSDFDKGRLDTGRQQPLLVEQPGTRRIELGARLGGTPTALAPDFDLLAQPDPVVHGRVHVGPAGGLQCELRIVGIRLGVSSRPSACSTSARRARKAGLRANASRTACGAVRRSGDGSAAWPAGPKATAARSAAHTVPPARNKKP